MTEEYEAQIRKYVAFAIEKGLLAIQDHITEHYEGDHLAQNVAMDEFMGIIDEIQY